MSILSFRRSILLVCVSAILFPFVGPVQAQSHARVTGEPFKYHLGMTFEQVSALLGSGFIADSSDPAGITILHTFTANTSRDLANFDIEVSPAMGITFDSHRRVKAITITVPYAHNTPLCDRLVAVFRKSFGRTYSGLHQKILVAPPRRMTACEAVQSGREAPVYSWIDTRGNQALIGLWADQDFVAIVFASGEATSK